MLYKSKSLVVSIIGLLGILFYSSSCVDNSYNWNNMDTSGVVNIPPVPLGNIDTLDLFNLPQIPELPGGGIPIEGKELVLRYTQKGLFKGNTIKHFFFDGADDIEISGLVDIKQVSTDIKITFDFDILDIEGNKIEEIVTPCTTLSVGKNQKLSTIIGSEYMVYMKDAYSLAFTLTLSADRLWVSNKDYIYLHKGIVRSGGLHVEL